MSSQYQSALPDLVGAIRLQTFVSLRSNHQGALGSGKHVGHSHDAQDSKLNLPGDGTITRVDFALRHAPSLKPPRGDCSERANAAPSFNDITIADIIVSVLPRPMSSASIPPRGRPGTFATLAPEITC